jgi:mannitol/fructose-specific phosphotransferase system IIA component (Ntr-type)
MKLSELIAHQHVLLPLRAHDKWDAIGQLARRAVQAGQIPERVAGSIEPALVTRERSMTTGLEHGIAIPHAAVDGIDELVAVLGVAVDGVPFDALDRQPAQILVCLVIPRSKKLQYIKTLAEIARLLRRPEVRQRLLQCDSADAVVACLRDVDACR